MFGMSGGCRGAEITNVLVEHVIDAKKEIVVEIPRSKTKFPKVFPITGEMATNIVRRYVALRPEHIQTNRFFILYRGGKCFGQPIGKNTIAAMPRKIAEWLDLSDPASYTGHSFRRTSTTILADAGATIGTIKRHGRWKSTKVAEGKIFRRSDSFKPVTFSTICRIHSRIAWQQTEDIVNYYEGAGFGSR